MTLVPLCADSRSRSRRLSWVTWAQARRLPLYDRRGQRLSYRQARFLAGRSQFAVFVDEDALGSAWLRFLRSPQAEIERPRHVDVGETGGAHGCALSGAGSDSKVPRNAAASNGPTTTNADCVPAMQQKCGVPAATQDAAEGV